MAELGIYPNKSLTVQFPEYIPNNLISHFVRGYFDGDGCISIKETSIKLKTGLLIDAKLTGNNLFLQKLESILKSLNIKCSLIKDPKENCWNLFINGSKNQKKFLDWIYKDATIYLVRKYNKYIKFINNRNFSIETPKEKNIRIKNQIKEIIQDKNNGMLVKDICKKYKISNTTLRKILNNK